MIRLHSFNSKWWGSSVGIVDDPAFFNLEKNEREALLTCYDWVEFRKKLDHQLPVFELAATGFAQVDTQIRFKLGLSQVPSTPSIDSMSVRNAEQSGFGISSQEIQPFLDERFLFLPGISVESINDRYVLWGNELIQSSPEWCLEILYQGRVQGWFLATPRNKQLNLALAMLHKNATISGLHLYQKAIYTYAASGAKIGSSSFSVTNTKVMGIYSSLGARFLAPEGCWLWIKP